MNVLITVTHLDQSNGGVCTHVLDLARGLKKLGCNVIIGSDYGYYMEVLKKEGFKVYRIPFTSMNNIKYVFQCLKFIISISKKEKINIIHSHGQFIIPLLFINKIILKIPFLWTNHIDAINKPKVFKWILKLINFPIISVSTDLKNFLINNFDVNENRIKVIYNGIDVSCFEPLTIAEQNELKNRYEIKNDELVISLLARIFYVKGHSLLLEAINCIQKERNIKFKVLFAGKVYESEKKYLATLEKYADSNNIDLKYCGFSSPRDIFGISNISTLPSLYEGFGLTAVESLAMHCPVIRSNTPGSTDMKKISLIHLKGNVKDLKDKIEFAIDNPEEIKAMTDLGYRMVNEVFNQETMCLNTYNYYKDILIK